MTGETELERFTEAQNRHWDAILAELRTGRKVTHWMWYVFPQMRGLGRSRMSWFYGLSGGEEARAYLAHPVLGPRLRQCCAILLGLEGVTAEQVFGPVDTLKLRSCMELFDAVEPGAVFAAVLGKWFGER
ncbi:MAG: DUF1810 domain-containing protein [Candidatus Zixiibacteriota bacterium]